MIFFITSISFLTEAIGADELFCSDAIPNLAFHLETDMNFTQRADHFGSKILDTC